MKALPKVTVLVPSYNHGRYLSQRIKSIMTQSYGNIELIVIDDCSVDDSHEVLQALQAEYDFQYLRNERNSGTPFAAWERVAAMASGDYIWICESDDFAAPEFLDVAIDKFSQVPDAVLFYCNSWVVDEDGARVGHTDDYFHDTWQETRWDNDFVAAGPTELAGFQIRGQTVPNMSSALIATAAFRRAYDPFLKRFKLTGDWLFIGWLMAQGAVIFSRETLSNFRKHEVTSRVRVKSARSQAEFLLTKYQLFRKTGKTLRAFAELLQTDLVRFLYEPARLTDVVRAMWTISPLKSLALAAKLGVSFAVAPKYPIEFYLRYRMMKRS